MITNDSLKKLFETIKVVPSESLESESIEFKEYQSESSLHNSKDLPEEISALSNYKGGTIIVGVRDSSNVNRAAWESQLVGFPTVDLAMTQERISGKLKPKMHLKLRHFEYEGKNYLIIDVPEKKDSLIATTGGKYCIRDGKSSRPMEPNEIKQSVKELQDYDWSSEILNIEPEESICEVALREALQDFQIRRQSLNISQRDFLEAIGATSNGRLTKSGLLFLGKTNAIRATLGNFEFRFSRKKRTGELLINEVWDNCIWHTIKKAKKLFDDTNSLIDLEFEEKRYKVQLVDSIAFHEAFLNAIVHRDYSIDGAVSIEFLDDKIQITSPGTFYGGVSSENIYKHEPRHRNKALARMLMEYHLVDRAGMGVLRMSLNSLKYGRDFPVFNEQDDSIIVTMQAQYIRPGVFVMGIDKKDVCGISEFVILNCIYEIGHVSVSKLIGLLKKIEDDPWVSIKKAVDNLPSLEICGSRDAVYVRVKPAWNSIFKAQKTLHISRASEKYVKLYDFLTRHKSASNADIRAFIGYKHSTQTSKFLTDTKFVKRSGRGPNAIWSLITI